MSVRPSISRSPLAVRAHVGGVPTTIPVAVSFSCTPAHRPRHAEVGHEHSVALEQDVVRR